jgi:hypothetical protein
MVDDDVCHEDLRVIAGRAGESTDRTSGAWVIEVLPDDVASVRAIVETFLHT